MNEAAAILIVEDDEILAQSLMTRLRLEGMAPLHAPSCEAALNLLATRRIDAVVSDIRLPDGSGEDVFWAESSRFSRTPTIFTTAYGEVEQAVRLVKLGATDYLLKPYELGALVARLIRLTSRDRSRTDDFVTRSPSMRRVVDLLDRIRDRSENVLMSGPMDCGRQTLARHLHDTSARAASPFVVVEGAALTAAHGDRVLFGARDTSGAIEPGLLDAVGDGTLLVTDIDEIAPDFQPRLLRFVGEHLYRPVGATTEHRFLGRIVATALASGDDGSNGRAMMNDLRRRFADHEIAVPPLADRCEDLLILARARLDEQIETFAYSISGFSDEAEAALMAHDWPGNLRELRNRIVRAAMTAGGETIAAVDLFPDSLPLGDAGEQTLEAARREAERHVIEAALAENGGRIVDTAKTLGISRVTLWSKMKRFGIEKA